MRYGEKHGLLSISRLSGYANSEDVLGLASYWPFLYAKPCDRMVPSVAKNS